jgi:hypothetical protein
MVLMILFVPSVYHFFVEQVILSLPFRDLILVCFFVPCLAFFAWGLHALRTCTEVFIRCRVQFAAFVASLKAFGKFFFSLPGISSLPVGASAKFAVTIQSAFPIAIFAEELKSRRKNALALCALLCGDILGYSVTHGRTLQVPSSHRGMFAASLRQNIITPTLYHRSASDPMLSLLSPLGRGWI